MRKAFLITASLCVGIAIANDHRVGVARIAITPEKPVWMSGYASRTKPAQGKVHDLWAKAVTIEDAGGGRVIIVGTDLIGLPRWMSDTIAARIQKRHGLERARILLNSSHTHTGPMIRGNLEMFDLEPHHREDVNEFTAALTERLVSVISASMADLKPANLAFGNGRATFGQNRREKTPTGIRIGQNPGGPTDADVPVLRITSPDGKIIAAIFGYACHNTTLTGEFYEFSGDYAGFAQIAFEEANPGATAVFLMLCGADQNPNPRSELELARQHGITLAAEVNRVAGGEMRPVRGRIRTAFRTVDLPFQHHTRETFESRLEEKNVFRVRHAKAMLQTYAEGRPIRSYGYPVQAIAFGESTTLLALGGEVVVDYALRVRKEYGEKGIIVAGYSNDVMAYIPSVRILREGGYEANDSMIYYGMPGPFTEEVEERIFGAIRQVMKRVGRK
jgi:hypothetical protein